MLEWSRCKLPARMIVVLSRTRSTTCCVIYHVHEVFCLEYFQVLVMRYKLRGTRCEDCACSDLSWLNSRVEPKSRNRHLCVNVGKQFAGWFLCALFVLIFPAGLIKSDAMQVAHVRIWVPAATSLIWLLLKIEGTLQQKEWMVQQYDVCRFVRLPCLLHLAWGVHYLSLLTACHSRKDVANLDNAVYMHRVWVKSLQQSNRHGLWLFKEIVHLFHWIRGQRGENL